MAELIGAGYEFHLVFLWLPSADVAVDRVAQRVKRGGHHVPEATVRRRYAAGLRNFFQLYRPLAQSSQMIHNGQMRAQLVASGRRSTVQVIRLPQVWRQIQAQGEYANGTSS
jgi:predicted ABC-type ATPase